MRNLTALAAWYALFTALAYSALVVVTGDWITTILPALAAAGAAAIVLTAASIRIVKRDAD